MKVIGLNGSPRKKFNTATVLRHALEGAESKGAKTEIINLYDYKFQGCISCFACKLKDNITGGICAVKDDVTSILVKMAEADAVIFGSPVYFADVTSSTRAILERFMYAPFVYCKDYSSVYEGKMKTACIYTMNVKSKDMENRGYVRTFETTRSYLERIYGHSEYITVNDTTQFADYSKYIAEAFDPVAKAKARKEVFPQDCEKAFKLGASLVD
ncbi:NADPH-dependent FMN reductase [Denitrovibrio acetiphilus DSM 12809]|uniref:NADPH-dependent FMN reductase n=1 Tax=Denitrovibrio acetiphilus (strain DSM 12809 / NBRC 114555 / N2460) TaxID=522772 RepID=D4H0T1_DENA2|nr:flavodoxin family protein [Denitrovibrio acetiphilus]ADD68594.1 NADPH-dependent FMN reductase [Denitrovibrio acetiphilus DSM 12809]